jgi:anthranilate phosphoribosyltransferase
VGAAWIGPLVAEALALRGMKSAIVVHSDNGLDEISPEGTTRAWMVAEGAVSERELRPSDFGLPEHSLSLVLGGEPDANAATLRAVLGGVEGPVSDFVLLNAAAACLMAGLVSDLRAGVDCAREAIRSGRAAEVLEQYVRLTHEVAGG